MVLVEVVVEAGRDMQLQAAEMEVEATTFLRATGVARVVEEVFEEVLELEVEEVLEEVLVEETTAALLANLSALLTFLFLYVQLPLVDEEAEELC